MTTIDLTKERALDLLRQMWEIRLFEDRVYDLLGQNVIKGASHLYAGEEAIVHVIGGTCGNACLKKIADDLADDIESIPGVLETEVSGGLEREIRIEVDPDACAQAMGTVLVDLLEGRAPDPMTMTRFGK